VPRTPDRQPGALEEDEEIRLLANPTGPTVAGAFNYDGTDFKMRDAAGTFNPRTGGSGLTESQHRTVRQLIHLAEEGGPFEGFPSGVYQETLPTGPFPTSVIWWTDSGKTDKIVEETITYNANKTINTDEWKVYDIDGSTVLATVTDTISYSGVFETSRTRTIA
jgi:hypothetical protein